jgi:hypothetical protein
MMSALLSTAVSMFERFDMSFSVNMISGIRYGNLNLVELVCNSCSSVTKARK